MLRWIVALLLALLSAFLGYFLRPMFEEWGKRFERQLRELGFNFEKNYLNALAEKYHYLKFVGVRDRPKAGLPKLEEVYISLHMSAPSQMDIATNLTELTLSEALRAHKNLVILGEPGAGKSTLLRYLVLVFAGIVKKSDLGLNEKRLPVYIRLKDCVGNDSPISELMAVPPTLPLSRSPIGFFEAHLRRGQCIVLLDGLDEMTDEAQKKSVAEKMAQLLGGYPDNRFIITCRTAGWDPNLLPGGLPVLKIRDLNPKQVARFIHGWYQAVLTSEKLLTTGADVEKQAQARQEAVAKANTSADDLLRRIEANEGLTRITKNPLILSLIALVHYNRAALPQRRAMVYQDCLDILLDRWDRDEHETVVLGALPLEVKHELAQAIAAHFQRKGVDEATERELENILAPILNARKSQVTPRDCLRVQIVARSGLLVERAIGRYGFAYRTLQDYLVAKQYAETPELRLELLNHLTDETWREVILLYIGVASANAATQTVRDILAQPDDAAQNMLLLAGQCLAENARIGDVVRQECLTRLQYQFQNVTDPLVFARVATTLANIGGEDVALYFERTVKTSSVPVRIVAIQALSTMSKRIPRARIAAMLLDALQDEHTQVRRAAVVSFGQLGYNSSEIIQSLVTLRQTDADQSLRTLATATLDFLQSGVRSFVPIEKNPYVTGGPLQTDDVFFGRESLVAEIATDLRGAHQDNLIILYGQRRTGKTSLLYALQRKLPPSQYVSVVCDVQGIDSFLSLFWGLALNIYDTCGKAGIVLPEPTRKEYEKEATTQFEHIFLRQVKSALGNRRLLIMMDEFEYLEEAVQSGHLPLTVFPFFRHLMQHQSQLSFIFCGTHQLQELTKHYWQIFFNIGLPRHVTFLDEPSTKKLIVEPVQGYRRYDPMALERLVELTGGHPFFTQLLCHGLVRFTNMEQQSDVTRNVVDEVARRFAQTGHDHLDYIWEQSNPAERSLLLSLNEETHRQRSSQVSWIAVRDCLAGKYPQGVYALDESRERLERRELIVSDGSQVRFSMALVSEWLAIHRSWTSLSTGEQRGGTYDTL